MGGEKVTHSWLSNLWSSRKPMVPEPQKADLGIMSHEVASLMSKLVNLWQCLSDRQVIRLREEIVNSLGIQKLVSEDDDYLIDLVVSEMVETLRYVGKAAAVLGKRCVDTTYHHLEPIFNGDPVEMDPSWDKWEYKLKKMERRAKKMERFVAATSQLYQELDVLAELEQTLRRMQAGAELGHVKLLEFQQKVVWQRQEVKNLQEMSPWMRSYDYIVRLLVRSIFTIIGRIQNVLIRNKVEDRSSGQVGHNGIAHSSSISALLRSSVHPSEKNLSKLYSGPIGRSFSTLGLVSDKSRLNSKQPRASNGHFLKGCMTGGDSPIVESCMPSSGEISKATNTSAVTTINSIAAKVYLFSSKHRLLDAPPLTLGHAALALHYANVIILIEKLASSPHLISLDARDDLYCMLPTTVRTTLRANLKIFKKSLTSSIYDAALASEWSSALSKILDWLSPLAHNTIRWHSERNFEKQHVVSGFHVLRVQTLYYANQAKTEAAITELLLGLNYLTRFCQELSKTPLLESTCGRASNDFSVGVGSLPHHDHATLHMRFLMHVGD
ncbi:hypothetical protein LIER_25748 [Lithospermum erythrorhizon]|uniref:Uncharacterized protein n=1 Tax=Lithospermum erythrorhizon TaxID=34254 RepID=A0AAV3R602_LITER